MRESSRKHTGVSFDKHVVAVKHPPLGDSLKMYRVKNIILKILFFFLNLAFFL